jgi:diguanylate cyclase (GGDEF)-like protein
MSAREALEHAEELRSTVEQTVFVVRGPDRSQRRREERRSYHRKRSLRSERVSTSVSISIGVADSGAGSMEVEDVIRNADRELYRAKKLGRNRVEMQR